MATRKILLVDADDASLRYLANVLRAEGYEVLLASSGTEGQASAWRDLPDAIAADPSLPDLSGEEFAQGLRADRRTAGVPLIAISSDSRPPRRRACLEAGFTEFLVKSPQLLPALREALAMPFVDGQRATRKDGLLICFLSAKGGMGTSSLCANLAMNFADLDRSQSVVVADLVLPIGSMADIVGYLGKTNVATVSRTVDAQMTPDSLRTSLSQMDAWRFHLLAGSPDPQSANELDVGCIGQIVTTLQAAFDIVVLDLGRALSRISLPLIERAHLVAMIIGADLTAADLSNTVWTYLQGRGVQPSAMYVIMNRVVGLAGLTREQAERIVGLPVQAAMPYLSENISLANYQHRPYCLKFPADTASIILSDAARQMLELARRRRAG